MSNYPLITLGPADILELIPSAPPPHKAGVMYYDPVTMSHTSYNQEVDIALQNGQELWLPFINRTGSTILNGEAIYINGTDSITIGGIPRTLSTVALAKSDAAATARATIAIATHDIEPDSIGFGTMIGTVRDLNTSGFLAGQKLWLSSANGGEIVNVEPNSPNFSVFMGNAGVIDGAFGTIIAHINAGGNTRDVIKIFNGATLESTSVVTLSNGTTITVSFEKSGGGDINLFFNAQFTGFEAPPATVVLTPGTDNVPVQNFIFIPESTNVMTANTTGFPTAQHCPVATIVCPSAATALTHGVYKEHAYTDHLSDSDDQGHLTHLNFWVRQQWATWLSGIDLTVAGSGTGTVTIETDAGTMLQLHKHTMPAVAAGADFFEYNDVAPSYNIVNGLEDMLLDSGGVALTNRYYSLVVWFTASQNAVNSHLFINLPDGSYTTETAARNDTNNLTDFNIPTEYKGTSAVAYRLLMRNQTDTVFTLIDTFDLRGLLPGNVIAGK